jgi:hypothetical protein
MTQSIYYQVSKEIYGLLVDCLKDEQGVHAETAVAAISAVCGEELLRASHVDLSRFPQGGIVLVDEVNDSGPRLLGHLEQLLNNLQVVHTDDWSVRIPPEHAPRRDPLKMAQNLRPQMQGLFTKHGLKESEAAYAACTALALLIRDCASVLPPAVSVVIASNVLVRATRSVPLA